MLPPEIEAAIADRNLLTLRTRLRQLVAGIRALAAFRFLMAPTARPALEALGFEVVKEEMSWWRSLPAVTESGARRWNDRAGQCDARGRGLRRAM